MTIPVNKKLRHETFLDFEMRKYYHQARIKGFINKPFPQIGTSSDEYVAELDSQGRHRSEWCYAPYDGRTAKQWNKDISSLRTCDIFEYRRRNRLKVSKSVV